MRLLFVSDTHLTASAGLCHHNGSVATTSETVRGSRAYLASTPWPLTGCIIAETDRNPRSDRPALACKWMP